MATSESEGGRPSRIRINRVYTRSGDGYAELMILTALVTVLGLVTTFGFLAGFAHPAAWVRALATAALARAWPRS